MEADQHFLFPVERKEEHCNDDNARKFAAYERRRGGGGLRALNVGRPSEGGSNFGPSLGAAPPDSCIPHLSVKHPSST